MKGLLLWMALGALIVPHTARAQREPSLEGPRPPRRPTEGARMGPWNRDLVILRSSDGKQFGQKSLFAERGGVPCLTQDAKGRLLAVYQWFPIDQREDFDRIAVVVSEDQGATWSAPRRVEFQGLPEEYARQFDPTLVALADGRYRLYFTSSRGRQPGQEKTAIYSAISSNGTQFTFEPEARFAVPEENVVDCAVARLGETWHLYAPLPREEGRAFHATSNDGLKFERQPDVSADVNGTWIGNVVNVEGTLRFFGSGRGGVWSARSRDGLAWEVEENSGARGGDPAVWRLKEGSYVMVVTGDLRADAPMDPPWRREGNRGPAGAEPGGREMPGPGANFAPAGGDVPVMTVADGFLYVLRDGVIYQYGARDLTFIRQAPLPEARRGPRAIPGRPMREGEAGGRPRPQ